MNNNVTLMKQNKIKPPDLLSKVRVGVIAELDPADDYTSVFIEVPHQTEELSPGEARELARMLNRFAEIAQRKE